MEHFATTSKAGSIRDASGTKLTATACDAAALVL
jgi:hypothetical protein